MNRKGSASAPKGAAGGKCRQSRRAEARRPAWVRPYRRAQRALDSAAKLIFSSFYTAVDAGHCAERRPLRTARRLDDAAREMTVASLRLLHAQRQLAEATEALSREPDQLRGEVPRIMKLAAARCEAVAHYIPITVQEVVLAQVVVLGGLTTGELVPERPGDDRPRIVITPRPLFVRAFLSIRQPRVSERITPALLRRRRTPRPAEIRVPHRTLQGRAPPLSSTCAL
ncbi:MAG TPA: hypothetical protein VGF48_23235 [Thermoanaerobaculia bacterium]|jgi:hypothetical protein